MATACKHKLGLLSLRDCKEPANDKCAGCGRPVCPTHLKQFQVGEVVRNLCVECYVQRVGKENALETGVDREYHRRDWYRRSSYRPYYYGNSHHHYQHDHYDHFDHDRQAVNDRDDSVDDDDFLDNEDFQDS